VVCRTEAVDRVRARVLDLLGETGFQLKSIGAVPTNTPGHTDVHAELEPTSAMTASWKNAVRMLGGEPGGVLGGLVAAKRDRRELAQRT